MRRASDDRSPPPILHCDDGSETELPWRWAICGSCDGHGTSSAYLGAFTRRDMEDDPEFFKEYMEGRYDRACDHCVGGRVRVVDRDRCTSEQLAAWDAQVEDDRHIDAIHRAERLMEGGWREEGWRD